MAKKNYKKSVKVDPSFFHSYNNLGILFQKQGEKEKAIENFKKVIETNSQYINAYNNLGLVYLLPQSLFYNQKLISLNFLLKTSLQIK